MQKKTIEEANKIYDLEIDKIVKTIKEQNVKKVLLQFPEGMKPYAQVVCDEIEKLTGCECMIWMGSCFGACDVPLEVKRIGIDIIVQFGHSKWDYEKYLKY